MPTDKKKRYHLSWTEVIERTAVIETDWTPEEMQAQAVSAEYSDSTRPAWEDMLDEQILEPQDHITARDLHLQDIILADPASMSGVDLPRDRKIELIDRMRELSFRQWGADGYQKEVRKLYEELGFPLPEQGDWGVMDRHGAWMVYQVSEVVARRYWEEHSGMYTLCASIVEGPGGSGGYVIMEERPENSP